MKRENHTWKFLKRAKVFNTNSDFVVHLFNSLKMALQQRLVCFKLVNLQSSFV